MVTPGIPQDLDDESLRKLARSFYVVKMLRYAALLVAALVFVFGSMTQDAPVTVTATLVVLTVALATAMVATHRRYLSSQQPPSAGPASPSPRG